jgi:hypothetical protein
MASIRAKPTLAPGISEQRLFTTHNTCRKPPAASGVKRITGMLGRKPIKTAFYTEARTGIESMLTDSH